MEQSLERLHPSTKIENIDLERRLEKQLSDVNRFLPQKITLKKRLLTSNTYVSIQKVKI